MYEYFQIAASSESVLESQFNYYLETLTNNSPYSTHTEETEEDEVFFDNDFTIEEQKSEEPSDISEDSDVRCLYRPLSFKKSEENADAASKDFEDIDSTPSFENSSKKSDSDILFSPVLYDDVKEEFDGHEIIAKMKADIENLKELGFYELLVKEIGGMLSTNENKFQPSRLCIDNDFKITLPEFNNMEIEMTPLPKALFFLFLRHPAGIRLKSLIDYKTELLEIYKLISYHENFLNMSDSINRICSPIEGSINEKLSRVKEAFFEKNVDRHRKILHCARRTRNGKENRFRPLTC